MWKLTKGTANLSGEKHYFPEFTATRKGLLQQSLHCLSVLLYNVTCIQKKPYATDWNFGDKLDRPGSPRPTTGYSTACGYSWSVPA